VTLVNKTCQIVINGDFFDVLESSSLMAVLVNNGIFNLKTNGVSGQKRFGICGMGTCFECEVTLKNVGVRRACLLKTEPGMVVETGMTDG
jgi:hypothetical protein